MKALLITFICLFTLVTACGGSDSDSGSGGASVDPGARNAAPDAPAAPGAGVPEASVTDAKLVLTSSLNLEVDSLRTSFETIGRLARDNGGFVADASFAETGDDSATAGLRLRVPATRHDDLVAALRGLDGAEVKREGSNAKEVTAEYTDLESRLVNLEHTEAQYQQLLTRAGTIDDVLKVTAKLDSVIGEIEKVRGRLRLIDDQADYATVSVQLALPPVAAATTQVDDGGLASPVRVFVD
ncbi:MAG TPA: DUF4349 domain-containing protein, partial [Dehalococcoidia bacterium]|nr:DUF4349 domain-containing protein [Dehalococcoidia bacterium]